MPLEHSLVFGLWHLFKQLGWRKRTSGSPSLVLIPSQKDFIWLTVCFVHTHGLQWGHTHCAKIAGSNKEHTLKLSQAGKLAHPYPHEFMGKAGHSCCANSCSFISALGYLNKLSFTRLISVVGMLLPNNAYPFLSTPRHWQLLMYHLSL